MNRPLPILIVAAASFVTLALMGQTPVVAPAAPVAVAPIIKQAPKTYSLKRVVKVGDVSKFRSTVDLNFDNNKVTHFTSTITETVTAVAENGDYTVEMTAADFLSAENVETPETVTPEDGPTAVTLKLNAAGELLEAKGAKPDREDGPFSKLGELPVPRAPSASVKIGESWKAKLRANDVTGNSAESIEYKLLDIKKVANRDVLRIHFKSMDEDGDESTEGTVWVDAETYALVGLRAKNHVEGAPEKDSPLSIKLTWARMLP